MPLDILSQLAVIFLVAIGAVLLLGRLGLPPIVGFLVAGVLVGPGGLGLVHDHHQVEILAELGVALLLFTIGMEFSLARLGRIWRYVVLGGGLQVVLTVVATMGIAAGIGAPLGQGAFWGYLAAVSSTAIVLQLLADRRETAAPHGRFIVGVLIFQDLCIVPMMLSLPMLAGDGGGVGTILWTLGKAILIVGMVLLLARKVVPAVLMRIAATRNRELFLLSVLVIALGVAWTTAELGLSIALGAFLAGVIIADTEFVHQAWSEIVPFRDVLASLFFVSVGMLLDPGVIVEQPWMVLGLFMALLLGKLVLATMAALLMRFPARVALVAGAGLAQVGEFSFVLLQSGQSLDLVNEEAARLFLASGVLTMITAPLLVAASPHVAAGALLLRPLEKLLRVRPEREAHRIHEDVPPKDHVVIAGLGVGGRMLLRALEASGIRCIALDLNPETVVAERKAGRDVRFGDVSSPEVLEHVAHLGDARLLALLLSDPTASRRALAVVRARYPKLPVVVRAQRGVQDADELRRLGAEVVCEDYETALEVTERVLRRCGIVGEVVRGTLRQLRETRTDEGARPVPPDASLSALALDTVELGPGDRLVDRSLAQSGLRADTGAMIVAIRRGDEIIANPTASFVMRPGDTLFLLGTPEQVARGREWVQKVYSTSGEQPPAD